MNSVVVVERRMAMAKLDLVPFRRGSIGQCHCQARAERQAGEQWTKSGLTAFGF